jgi:hypothetical protein
MPRRSTPLERFRRPNRSQKPQNIPVDSRILYFFVGMSPAFGEALMQRQTGVLQKFLLQHALK